MNFYKRGTGRKRKKWEKKGKHLLGEKDILTKNAMCVFNIFGDF